MPSPTDTATDEHAATDAAPATSPGPRAVRYLSLALAAVGAYLVAQTVTQELLTTGGSYDGAALALRVGVGALAIVLGLAVWRVSNQRGRSD